MKEHDKKAQRNWETTVTLARRSKPNIDENKDKIKKPKCEAKI